MSIVFRVTGALALGLVVSGCGDRGLFGARQPAPVEPAPAAQPAAVAPESASQPALGLGRSGASAEALDTTTQAERVAAATPPTTEGEPLGTTTASLGPPSEGGFWLRTGLVTQERQGRVTHSNGNSVRVTLKPSGSAPGAGSQLSLAAFRALEIPLTQLPELTVYAE